MPEPKSSRAKRQPSSRSAPMKAMAFARLAIALVSVISKQIESRRDAVDGELVADEVDEAASPKLVPDMLMAQVSTGVAGRSRAVEQPAKALRTTQRSIERHQPVALGGAE